MATISVPPVLPLFRNTIPNPHPLNKPAKITAMNGSDNKGSAVIGINLSHNVRKNTP
jgi:hypothetical protein